jgi:hypothetical protein
VRLERDLSEARILLNQNSLLNQDLLLLQGLLLCCVVYINACKVKHWCTTFSCCDI